MIYIYIHYIIQYVYDIYIYMMCMLYMLLPVYIPMASSG